MPTSATPIFDELFELMGLSGEDFRAVGVTDADGGADVPDRLVAAEETATTSGG